LNLSLWAGAWSGVKGGKTLTRCLRPFEALALAVASVSASPIIAVADPAPVTFDIPAGPLNGALLAYAAQAHCQLLYASALVAGLTTTGLKGRFTQDEALTRLLSGAGIVFDHTGLNVIVLKRVAGPVGLVRPDDGQAGASAEVAPLLVTGTQIRRAQTISPLISISRDAMDQSGQATVADMLQALPQNFGGVATPASEVLGTDRIGTNDTGAAGVNLRGLGATATLVLVNGRRMAGSGIQGDFADVSAIPSSAVDHVEVLLDGASAIYGSDAVGGVVNIILRRDFNGAETRLLNGFTSDGGAQEFQVGQTFGKSWKDGNLTLSLEFDRRWALHGDQRPYTANADLAPLGGTDERSFFALPGNVLETDPATGNQFPAFAIPSGQNGTNLTPASFLAGQTNLTNQREGADTLPKQERYSLYANFTQDLGDRVTFDGDIRYSDRRFSYALPQAVAEFNVTNANPYFASPNGTTSELIAYSFTKELGPLQVAGAARNFGASGGFTVDLGRAWQAEVYGAYAEEIDHRDQDHTLDSAFLNAALGDTPVPTGQGYTLAQDGYFNPFGDGASNSRATLNFIDSGFFHTQDDSQVTTANLKIDGPLFGLPGGAVKIAFGGQVRWERFEDHLEGEESNPTPTTVIAGPYDRMVAAAFAELRIPIVGTNNTLPGIQRLELSVAGRYEHYDEFGDTTNPKLGLLWSPTDGLKLRATWGTSFRAPSLPEVFQPSQISPGFLPEGTANELVLFMSGGNRDLKPETATSWTVGFDLAPPQVHGLTLSATWFDTHFTNRIGTPVSDNIFDALGNPTYASFVTPINPNTPADVAKVSALLAQSTSPFANLFPANAYAFIVDGREVNTGGLTVRGLDLNGAYGLPIGRDRLTFTANASILVDYIQQVTPTATPVSLLNTGGQPVSVRGRGGGTWRHGPFETSLMLNYVGAYHDVTGRRISPWTTADVRLQWRPEATGALGGTTFALNIQNLTDAAPPFFNAPQGIGYDPANANPLGRVISFQVIKRW
jgi:outer membrane receptor protein involved in Fe transport